MIRLKAMPVQEKFQHAFEMVRLYQKHVLPFVESHLGYGEMHNLRSVWRAGIIPIHEKDSVEDKYTQAYSNWLWMARCSHDALADQLSNGEVLEYKRLLLSMYERRLNNPDLAVLRVLRAHRRLAKAYFYEMQWQTPLELTSYSKTGVTCLVRECKIRQTPGTERVCRVDCQHVGAAYARKVYHLKRVTTQFDHGCEISLTPWKAS